MVVSKIRSNLPVDDDEFDRLFPRELREQSFLHFTPVDVAIFAANFLAHKPGVKVLDIGAGVGKFCLVGAVTTEGCFTGVELRPGLHKQANRLRSRYRLANLHFVLGNVTDLDLSRFQAFYFFNPFFENLLPGHRLDDELTLNRELYHRYSTYVHDALDNTPTGTRLVTYYSSFDEVPKSFRRLPSSIFPKLECWEKT